MLNRFYFFIKFIPQYTDNAFLIGRCIKVSHAFFAKHKVTGVGVSFPCWSEQDIGNALAFVSTDMKELEQLKAQPLFSVMADELIFEISDVLSVPDNLEEERFTLNYAIRKSFAGDKKRRLKRAKKRAEARGETYKPVLHMNTEKRVFDHYHTIPMNSKEKPDGFTLHVQKELGIEQHLADFLDYGFATNEQHRGTVPKLSSLMK